MPRRFGVGVSWAGHKAPPVPFSNVLKLDCFTARNRAVHNDRQGCGLELEAIAERDHTWRRDAVCRRRTVGLDRNRDEIVAREGVADVELDAPVHALADAVGVRSPDVEGIL